MTNNKHLHVDPNKHYRQTISPADVFQSLGFIPQFWFTSTKDTVAESLEENYEFFTGWIEDDKAKVEDGLFIYPKDLPLYPLAKYWINDADEYALQYQYGMIAICDKNGDLVKWTRMD